MEQQVLAFMKKHHIDYRGNKLLLACSGGADSVAIVRFYHQHAHEMGWSLGIVHADHQLRGKASTGDREFVEQLGQALGIPVYSKALAVPERLSQGGNTQQVCREERYSYFSWVMETQKFDVLVQGHHADDQVETVFMQLVKGTDASGVGIPVHRTFQGKPLIRPFLSVTRQDIELYLHTMQQPYRQDASNASDTYTRNRFRHHIVPLLQEENSSVAKQIEKFVERQREDQDYLDQQAHLHYEQLVTDSSETSRTLDRKGFVELPIALQRRIILLLWNYLQPQAAALASSVIDTILHVAQQSSGTQYVHLPNAFRFIRSYDQLLLVQEMPTEMPVQQTIPFDQWMSTGMGTQILVTGSEQKHEGDWYYLQLEEQDFPLRIRTREPGDTLDLGSYHKKVTRLFIDEKVAKQKREGWPLLVTQKNGILGLIGLRYSSKLNKTNKTPWVIWIKQEDSTC